MTTRNHEIAGEKRKCTHPITEVIQNSDTTHWAPFGRPSLRSNLESESNENAHASSSRKSANSLMHEQACTINNTEVEREISSEISKKCGDSNDESSNGCLEAERIMVPSGEYPTDELRTKGRVS